MQDFKIIPKNKKNRQSPPNSNAEKSEKSAVPACISKDLECNINAIRNIMGNASDIQVREFAIVSGINIKSAVIALKGLTNTDLINEQVLVSLMSEMRFKDTKTAADLFEQIKQSGIPNVHVNEEVNIENTVSGLISGNSVLFLDGMEKALVMGS
jgi:spore germination protein KA